MLNMLMVEAGRAAGQPGVGAASGSRSFKGGLLGYPVPHPPSAGDAVLGARAQGPRVVGGSGRAMGHLGAPPLLCAPRHFLAPYLQHPSRL